VSSTIAWSCKADPVLGSLRFRRSHSRLLHPRCAGRRSSNRRPVSHSQRSRVPHTGVWRALSCSTAYIPIEPYIQYAASIATARGNSSSVRNACGRELRVSRFCAGEPPMSGAIRQGGQGDSRRGARSTSTGGQECPPTGAEVSTGHSSPCLPQLCKQLPSLLLRMR